MFDILAEKYRAIRQDSARDVATLPMWVLPLLIVVTILFVSLFFLWPSFAEFPMDDSYIHMVYAQNLVDQGRLIFSFTDEIGVGTTSILWVLLLSAGYAIGLPLAVVAKIVGWLSLAIVGVSLFLLLRPTWPPLVAFAAVLLAVLSGNMIWFALSGMETMLFLALGFLSLLLYREERWILLGVTSGLLILTRPEGLLLLVALGIVELIVRRHSIYHIASTFAISMMIFVPWSIYLWLRTGHILPTSASGKRLAFAVATRHILEQYDGAVILADLPIVTYVAAWTAYLAEFALGGISLPPPQLVLTRIDGLPAYSISLWALLVWAGIAWLIFVAVRRIAAARWWKSWLREDHRRPLLILLIWTLLHNLSYTVYMPVPGTASRYGALNHMMLWLVVAAGLLALARRPRLQALLAVAVLVTAVANTVYWKDVYDANLEHMTNVRIAAANYVRDRWDSEELCAAYDVGAMRYFSKRPILDLGGLIDPEARRWFKMDASDRYLAEHGVSCLILPGRVREPGDGWLDIATMMGLPSSSLFDMELVKVFEIDPERWLLGYLPTSNYQASVTIYKLEPTDTVLRR